MHKQPGRTQITIPEDKTLTTETTTLTAALTIQPPTDQSAIKQITLLGKKTQKTIQDLVAKTINQK